MPPQPIGDPALIAEQMDHDLRALPDASVAAMRGVRRTWSSTCRQLPGETVLAAAIDLLERYHHRWIAYELILYHHGAAALLDRATVERLADGLRSWGDVDQFAVLLAGPAWRAGLIEDAVVHEWARREDHWWRRAALVATVPLNVRSRGGRGDVARTLALCEPLAADHDDMVEKALSWALRELVVHDREAVAAFLALHEGDLGARVKREVRNKLATGLKGPRRPQNRTKAAPGAVDSPPPGLL